MENRNQVLAEKWIAEMLNTEGGYAEAKAVSAVGIIMLEILEELKKTRAELSKL